MTDSSREPLALSVRQAAKLCNISERKLRDYIAQGQLKVSRAGRRVLVRPQRIDEFLRDLEGAAE